ncbi:MAG: transaldolase [Campylobacter sp.]|nr:transaldolase [Campylobacter sp.]
MYSQNFSLWCDFVEREFIGGEFLKLIANNIINGATSNPAIFKNAILTSDAYSAQKKRFNTKNSKELYEILATTDIRLAAQSLLKNYVTNDGGFISIEVDPRLSMSEGESYKEGKRLYSAIGMPNVMIKIPATKASYGAMSSLLAKGININATLVFSPEQVVECLEAIKEGTRKFKERFSDDATVPSAVISIFVSRFDRLFDPELSANDRSKVGVYNATKCYHIIKELNLPNTKALFASTSVKGDELPASYYVDELMFEGSINTAPLSTVDAFIRGKKDIKIPLALSVIDEFLSKFDMTSAYNKLLDDGLKQFEVAFDEILTALR